MRWMDVFVRQAVQRAFLCAGVITRATINMIVVIKLFWEKTDLFGNLIFGYCVKYWWDVFADGPEAFAFEYYPCLAGMNNSQLPQEPLFLFYLCCAVRRLTPSRIYIIEPLRVDAIFFVGTFCIFCSAFKIKRVVQKRTT